MADVITARKLDLTGSWQISFDREEDVILHRRKSLSAHPNGMTFTALSADGTLLREGTFYSVGGGFEVNEHAAGADRIVEDTTEVPFPFTTGAQLLAHCKRERMRISDIMLANALTWRRKGNCAPNCCISGRSCRNACTTDAIEKPQCSPGGSGAPTCPEAFYGTDLNG